MTGLVRTRRIAREAALWVGGALGALCLVSLVAGWVLHVTPLVFASGSMTPSYGVGSLGIARDVAAADLRTGDVVSVLDSSGRRVTHRIVAIEPVGDDARLTLRGDANDTDDGQTYRVASAPRVALDIPYAGYALNAAASPFGVAVAAAGVMGLLLLAFGGTPRDGARRRVRTWAPTGVVAALAVGGLAGASGAAPWAFTSAYWTDSATATSTASLVDTTAPAVAMTYPTGGSVTNNAWRNSACATAGLCGTATDNTGGSGLTGSASYELRDTTTGTCWDGGSGFVAGSCGSYQTAGGTAASWSIPVPFSALTNKHSYELRIKVGDLAGNTNRSGATPPGTPSTATVTFTV